MALSNDSINLGKYRIIAELGHGGMADVYLAVVRGPVGFNKLVVIKQLRPHLAEVPDFLDMFLDEARLAARLNHPNVVQTNEVVEEGNRYFIAMEYLDGQSYDRVLRRGQKEGKLTLGHRLRVLSEVLAGLHYAHELADFDGTPLCVVHRDVTPHNVFITYEGQSKVVDFGIAKAANCSAETRTGVLKGKVAYMAPEQARGDEVDRRADIFSVGLMLWESLAEARPWKGLTDIQILGRLGAGTLAPPSSVKPGIAPELERICNKATAFDREQRYATAAEMQADIDRYIDSAGLRVAPRDLGVMVSELFQDRRTEIRSIIDAQLREVRSMPTGEFPAKSVGLIDLSTTNTLLGLSSASLPSLHAPEGEAEPVSHSHPTGPSANRTGSRPAVASTVPPDERPARSKTPLIVATVLGLAALVGGGVVVSSKSPPAATLAAAPADPTAAATLADIKITASPPDARLFLDDAPLPTNPFSAKFPRDGATHRLRVEAPGYVSKTELLTFSGDVATEISLQKTDEVAAAPQPTPEKRPQPAGGGRAAAPQPNSTSDPALPPPKTKKEGRRQLDTDDPWAK